jgi:hypothetical protein
MLISSFRFGGTRYARELALALRQAKNYSSNLKHGLLLPLVFLLTKMEIL